jgi:hypothetical protein
MRALLLSTFITFGFRLVLGAHQTKASHMAHGDCQKAQKAKVRG